MYGKSHVQAFPTSQSARKTGTYISIHKRSDAQPRIEPLKMIQPTILRQQTIHAIGKQTIHAISHLFS